MAISRLSPQEVSDAPELLVLAAIDTNLWILDIALIAVFPELVDEWARRTDSPSSRAARRLSDAADTLKRAIVRYRKILQAQRAPPAINEDLPF